jgi:hypothetical protein
MSVDLAVLPWRDETDPIDFWAIQPGVIGPAEQIVGAHVRWWLLSPLLTEDAKGSSTITNAFWSRLRRDFRRSCHHLMRRHGGSDLERTPPTGPNLTRVLG